MRILLHLEADRITNSPVGAQNQLQVREFTLKGQLVKIKQEVVSMVFGKY